tara:strand:+ start:10480 stop:10683 length:204 start_codon:yes stop_codon:yes gene_type:complete
MIITIKIKENEINDMLAVGARDLAEHVLPKSGINPEELKISHIDETNLEKRSKGEEYSFILDTWKDY